MSHHPTDESRARPRALRRALHHTVEIAAPPEQVFPMLTPEGERAWVPGWDPAFVPPGSEPSRVGSVFRTDHDGETTLWMVVELDPQARRARYIRHTEGSRIALVSVACQPCAIGTRVDVSYDVTGLCEAGVRAVQQMDEAFAETIASWKPRIEAVLVSSSPAT